MALQELSPMPRPTGLSTLGAVLLGASERYAQNRRQDQLRADDRARQDSLLLEERTRQDRIRQEERDFQLARDETARRSRLEDDATLSRRRMEDASIQALINEGLLDPMQRDNLEAVRAATELARQNGLEKLYEDLLTAPGPDGTPLLRPEQVGDRAAVQAAKTAYNALQARETQRVMQVPAQMQAEADRVAQELESASREEQQIIEQLQQLDTVIQSGGRPTEAQILQEATRIATERAAGRRGMFASNTATDDEIRAATAEAVPLLAERNVDLALARQAGLREQLAGARNIRASLAARQNALINQKAFPSVGRPSAISAPPPTSFPATPGVPPSGSPMGGFLRQLEEEAVRQGSAAQPSPMPATPAPQAPVPATATPRAPILGADANRNRNNAVGDAMRRTAYGITNVLRPSNWENQPGASGSDVLVYSPDEQRLLQQLESRLEALGQTNSPTAQRLRQEIDTLRSRLGVEPQQAGRPITPSAGIFPTGPWWSAA